MKRILISFIILCSFGAANAITVNPLKVTSVVSTPVTGITEITYNLLESGKAVNGTYNITAEVSFDNGDNYLPIPQAHLSGHVSNVSPGIGKKITWNGGASFPNRYSTETMVRLTATPDVFVCGVSTVKFMYNESEVTYGTVVGAAGKCWLDRNLGASQVATISADVLAYGDLFQWGRAADGHQLRSSGTTISLSGNDTPGIDFILTQDNAPYDWRNPGNNDLWQGVNGINNPCPPGFRVPTKTEWEAESANWTTNNFGGAFNSPLKLTIGGYRSEIGGNIENLNSYGFYWSSTVNTDGGIRDSWRIQLFETNTIVSSRRADGFSVRCIKNQDPLK